MKHRGEIVEKAVRQSGVPISEIARSIGYNRKSMYDFFQKADLGLDIVIQIGKAIRHDFRKDFPELFFSDRNEVGEPVEDYKSSADLEECIKERNEWMYKYIDLLEQHNALLKGELQKYFNKDDPR